MRGPKHVVKTGKNTVMDAEQAHKPLDSIDISNVVGLRDRALISAMTAWPSLSANSSMNVPVPDAPRQEHVVSDSAVRQNRHPIGTPPQMGSNH